MCFHSSMIDWNCTVKAFVGAGFLYRQHADNCAMLPSGPAKLISGRMAFSAFSVVTECIISCPLYMTLVNSVYLILGKKFVGCLRLCVYFCKDWI